MWLFAWLLLATPAPATRWDIREPAPQTLLGPRATCKGCLPLALTGAGAIRSVAWNGRDLAVRTDAGWFVQGEPHELMSRPSQVTRSGEAVLFAMQDRIDVGQQLNCYSDVASLEQHYHVMCALGPSGAPSCVRLPDTYAATIDQGRWSYCSARDQPRTARTIVHANRTLTIVQNRVSYSENGAISTIELNFP